ncbi:MAG: bacillithiol biosynthesis BshC [Candidatus Bathyarchaeota archaeon]|nr:bacillithiol biosynthesis BshC [Candidatus Bathyarchaeota archaeon]
MTSELDRPPAHVLYSDHLENRESSGVALDLWGSIPATMGEAYSQLLRKRKAYGRASDAIEELKKVMKGHLRGMGLLTSRAEEGIDGMERGVVEAGQQPYCLGGSGLILNKIAYISTISNLGEDGFTPLFYVADYDGVQPELVNARVPSPSPRGLLMTYPAGAEYEDSPIYELPNPPEQWLKDEMERIEGNYRGLLRNLGPEIRERALQNLSHAFTILRNAYYTTSNVSDWATKVVVSLVNLESDLGVPVLQFSTPEARRLFQPGYELLLAEPNRSRFIEAANRASDIIEESGCRSPIGRRREDYVPFYLECPSPGCHRTRVELGYHRDAGSATAHVNGKCPKCGAVHEFSFDAGSPDLSEIADRINPRVDSRQVVVDSVIPVLAHVGGPGETSYYAEVIPAARALGVPFPAFLRYTRTFYNTPWNKRYSDSLQERGYPTLMNEGLFSALGRWVEARNSEDGGGLGEAHRGIKASIERTFNELLGHLQALQSEVEGIKVRLREPNDRNILIKEMRRKQGEAHRIEVYLSSAFGRFSPERFGQEVSWAWLDLAAASGVGDLMGVYLRLYNGYTPNSSMFFVNVT